MREAHGQLPTERPHPPDQRGFHRQPARGSLQFTILCAVTSLLLCWLHPTRAGESSLRIGLLLPPDEAAAESVRRGAELGVEQANALNGPKLGLIVRGRVGQWGDDGVEAARMVLDDGARALIVPPGGTASHLGLQVAGRTATPVVSLCGDSSVLGAGIPWMVRLAPGTSNEANVIFSAVPGRRWMALIPRGRAGREAWHDLDTASRATGSRIVKSLEVATNLDEVPGLAVQVQAASAEGVLLWLDGPAAGRVARALRQGGFRGVLAGPGWLRSPDFLRAAGDAAEGFLAPAIVRDRPSEAVFARFAGAYRVRFGVEPDPTAALAHDAALLLARVLRESGAETPRLAFPLLQSMPGASGPLVFDRNGHRLATLNLLVCRHGGFTIRSTNNEP